MRNRKVDMRRRIRAPDPLERKIAEVLERIIENPKTANGFQKLVPDVDFFLGCAQDYLEYWTLKEVKGLDREDPLVKAIIEKINMQERTGENLGFSLETLHAMGRAIARQVDEHLKTPKEMTVWLSRVTRVRNVMETRRENQTQEQVTREQVMEEVQC